MKVAIIKKEALEYCHTPPFHPAESYPEYPFADTADGNMCYEAVRRLLYQIGMDRDNFGKPAWNPLGGLISPGDKVFLKPNFVTHKNKVGGAEPTITHGSIIRAVLDYVYIALNGRGKICIGDAPYIDTDFSTVQKITGMDRIAEYYRNRTNLKVEIIDLRKEKGTLSLGRIRKEQLEGDPLGYSVVDLRTDSEHAKVPEKSNGYRVAFYDRKEMLKHHAGIKNEYFISNSILDADVVISLPKIKTHAKTGISCSLKNLVGINGIKDWLPHHRAGPAERGGDEYQYSDVRKDIFTWIKDEIPASGSILKVLPLRAAGAALFATKFIKPFKDNYDAGSWFGNETLPRTIVDLNKILLYADKEGIMRDEHQRKLLVIADGIVAGEREGPMSTSARKCGVLVGGFNAVAVDIACSRIMGFDDRKIPTISYAMKAEKFPLFSGDYSDIQIVADLCPDVNGIYGAYNCALEPPKSWKGHIEYEGEKAIVSPVPAPVATASER